MLKLVKLPAMALCLAATMVTPAAAQTIKVLVMQSDSDRESLRRNTRIQNGVLTAFNQGLSAPSAAGILEKYGLDGLDVYNEVSLTLSFDTQNRPRRTDQELLTVLRGIRSPKIDIVVLYTLYARAVRPQHATYTNLHMSLNYRALDARSGRFIGGDNIDLDPKPMTGCATGRRADRHCVKEFVGRNAERLVRDGATVLATQVASMLGPFASTRDNRDVDLGRDSGSTKDGYADRRDDIRSARASRVCRDLPRQFRVTFQGLSKRDVRYVTERMDAWACRLDIGLDSSSPSESSYSFKVRANEAKLKRNLEMTMEFIGIEGNIITRGRNELVVKAIPLRRN